MDTNGFVSDGAPRADINGASIGVPGTPGYVSATPGAAVAPGVSATPGQAITPGATAGPGASTTITLPASQLAPVSSVQPGMPLGSPVPATAAPGGPGTPVEAPAPGVPNPAGLAAWKAYLATTKNPDLSSANYDRISNGGAPLPAPLPAPSSPTGTLAQGVPPQPVEGGADRPAGLMTIGQGGQAQTVQNPAPQVEGGADRPAGRMTLTPAPQPNSLAQGFPAGFPAIPKWDPATVATEAPKFAKDVAAWAKGHAAQAALAARGWGAHFPGIQGGVVAQPGQPGQPGASVASGAAFSPTVQSLLSRLTARGWSTRNVPGVGNVISHPSGKSFVFHPENGKLTPFNTNTLSRGTVS